MRLVFDRGTVLVAGVLDPVVAAEIPGLLWDPRVRAYRAPAYRHAEVASALARGGVRFSDTTRPDGEALEPWRPISLRDYQAQAVAAWTRAGRRGTIVLPTGSGKTRVGFAAMAAARVATLCLVPTRVLLDQWCVELARFYPHAIGRLGDGAHQIAPVTVATYESAYRHMARLGDRFELLVVDEVHHFGTGIRDEALEMSLARWRLGLTATPITEVTAAARVADLIGPVVYHLGIADLAGTFLAGFDIVPIQVELTPAERPTYAQLVATYRPVLAAFLCQHPGGTWRDFTVAASRTDDGRRAVSAWRASRRLVSLCAAKRATLGELLRRHRDARVLVFVADNAAAYAIARAHLIMPLTCDIGRAERADALERFRRGELRALVSSRVLNEGLDVPDADIAVVVGGTMGEREHVQRVGRLLRPAPGKRAVVYELVARDTHEVAQAARRRKGLAARGAAALSHPG